MTAAIRAFLGAARIPITPSDRARTSSRVARAWASSMIAGYGEDPEAEITWQPVPRGGGLVVLGRISFHSTCAHHLLPFFGTANVAYLPRRRLAGLSKIARVVDILARRLQIQESLTNEIVEVLVRALRPEGAACLVEAEHLCVACRGVRKPGVRVVTTRLTGRLAEGELRAETLRLLDPR